jgi:beta-N-acetylhexosaminidase
VITGILRKRLHYDGVVFSDDIEMKAIADDYGLETAVEKAINAGVDMIILGNNMGNFSAHLAQQVFEIIKKDVLSGKIPADRIAQAYQRIQELKQRLKSTTP